MLGRKKKTDYFHLLSELTSYTVRAADFMAQTLATYCPDGLMDLLVQMHEIEHAADLALHALNRKLAREFITPIERQDIFSLGNMIDDVTDSIEDVLMRLYMFNIRELRPEALEFSSIIVDCAQALTHVMDEFQHFRKSDKIVPLVIRINDLEEEGDAIYVRSIRRLYETAKDPVEVIAWTELFRRLEHCCDDFEGVSQAVEQVIMKNT